MVAKIVRMPPPVQITDEDLEITETACRDNAARCPRKGAIEEAEHWERDSRQYRPCADPAMAQRGLNTLADLGDRHVIYSMCDPCGRSTELKTKQLIAVYGAEFAIAELKRRLTFASAANGRGRFGSCIRGRRASRSPSRDNLHP